MQSQFDTISTRIQQACQLAQRIPHSVGVLAVTKTVTVERVRAAYACGQRAFAENYVQEGLAKIIATKDLADIEWHLIGALQSNKTREVAAHFDWVQSIDRLKIAERLSAQRLPSQAPLQVCIQVNISGEISKSGCAPAGVLALAQAVACLPHLHLRGLMAIPSAASALQLAEEYTQLQLLFGQLQAILPQCDTLSVGMSGDIEQAVAAGSTLLRIGTALFGMR